MPYLSEIREFRKVEVLILDDQINIATLNIVIFNKS